MSHNFKDGSLKASLNGHISSVYVLELNTTKEIGIITRAPIGTEIILKFGRHAFDLNPIIGYLANVQLWDKYMEPEGKSNLARVGKTLNSPMGYLTKIFHFYHLWRTLHT